MTIFLERKRKRAVVTPPDHCFLKLFQKAVPGETFPQREREREREREEVESIWAFLNA